ncbi:uncharacterized protein LOC111296277 isoform X2 [Durio zibethinus]|uniref:Uncharacterized protein LOC111296277 isoform X2 n=1 Tax=Durio zibethinus TaxID=66656 RepID=A0A6P5Z0W3_DURZI|nr:uncharacterized protein LOC111296277 isoform X2 [Durio zibethinus]
MASEELLKPFYQRAIQAEERLSRLEAVLADKKDDGNQEVSKLISELQAKIEDANAETRSEREKAKKLAVENEKLKYRIAHLVQAVREADQKLESMRDDGNQEVSKLISELQAKIEDANAETRSEREKAKKLAVENEKLKYRIAHLVQAVREADQKLESMRDDGNQEVSKLISELQAKIEDANAETRSERDKVMFQKQRHKHHQSWRT